MSRSRGHSNSAHNFRLTPQPALLHGVLINAPNWLKSFDQGDEVSFPLAQLADWLCALDGTVYGAHTIQIIRSRMNHAERAQHDEAWGMTFPSPDTVLIPERNKKFEGLIADLITKQLAKDPSTIEKVFDQGRTLLHLEALYGRAPSVRALLDHGASASARCGRGWTPLDYAQVLEWNDVVTLLKERA